MQLWYSVKRSELEAGSIEAAILVANCAINYYADQGVLLSQDNESSKDD